MERFLTIILVSAACIGCESIAIRAEFSYYSDPVEASLQMDLLPKSENRIPSLSPGKGSLQHPPSPNLPKGDRGDPEGQIPGQIRHRMTEGPFIGRDPTKT
jgi:hypothetical protein